MPKQRISEEEVLRAAAEVVRKRGVQALGARAVAEELGCSTQPIYSLFGGMEGLLCALHEEAKRRYGVFIEEYLKKSLKSRYEAYGMGFVKFAREEKGLFRLLFLADGAPAPEDPYLPEILSEMCSLYAMDEQTARAFHADMAVFSYGLAVRVNCGDDTSESEIEGAFAREFFALYAYYFPTRPHFWKEGA